MNNKEIVDFLEKEVGNKGTNNWKDLASKFYLQTGRIVNPLTLYDIWCACVFKT